ncbi:MAG: hypothetical protein ABEJ30_07330 [Halorientalis sp.]
MPANIALAVVGTALTLVGVLSFALERYATRPDRDSEDDEASRPQPAPAAAPSRVIPGSTSREGR